MTSRRDFMKAAGAAAIVLGTEGWATGASGQRRKLKVLVIGGTRFLGPPTVEGLIKNGHEVTLFNRGRSNPELFPELEKLVGDRREDLSALDGRKFDAVIDTCGYFPKDTKLSTEKLQDSGFYLFVSTVSVYRSADSEDTDENSEVHTLEQPETVDRITNETYGPLKYHTEVAAMAGMKDKCCVVRPGLIVGPGDPTDRFTYWPARIARGGRVLAPGQPEWGTQYIDVRDLADWIVTLCEKKTCGTFNAIGPKVPVPMIDLMKSCKKVTKSDAEFVWADCAFMEQEGIGPWSDMPLFMGKPKGDRPAIVSNERALKAGLKYRSLEDTVTATLAYHNSLGADRTLKWGISAEREREALVAWDQKVQESEAK